MISVKNKKNIILVLLFSIFLILLVRDLVIKNQRERFVSKINSLARDYNITQDKQEREDIIRQINQAGANRVLQFSQTEAFGISHSTACAILLAAIQDSLVSERTVEVSTETGDVIDYHFGQKLNTEILEMFTDQGCTRYYD